MYQINNKRIWVAGHNGMVGRAVVNELKKQNCTIITASRHEVDLVRQAEVEAWITENKPDAIIICAAKVGGILANNTYPADFIYENLMIETNIIHAAFKKNVDKLVFLGSSCIYPKEATQPITEDQLLTGPLETTNEWYAIAKIAGIKLCEAYRQQHGCNFISVMPTNLYGPFDNFDLETSHVIPALIKKAHDAKMAGSETMEVWGSGRAEREFLYVDDCANGIVFLLKNYDGKDHVNLGTGQCISISDTAEIIKNITGFEGPLIFNTQYPDGTIRKTMDVSKIHAMGWRHKVQFIDGIKKTYDWFLATNY